MGGLCCTRQAAGTAIGLVSLASSSHALLPSTQEAGPSERGGGGKKSAKRRNVFIDDIADVDDDEEEDEDDDEAEDLIDDKDVEIPQQAGEVRCVGSYTCSEGALNHMSIIAPSHALLFTGRCRSCQVPCPEPGARGEKRRRDRSIH